MTLHEKQRDLIQRFSGIRNSQERFSAVVDLGRRKPSLPPELKTDAFRVEGCLSKLWLVPEFLDGKCYFRCDADSLIVKAIASLLCEFYSGHSPEEILAVNPAFLAEVGITQHLTSNRRNALSRVYDQIRFFAQQHR